jgi:hypothetical protein
MRARRQRAAGEDETAAHTAAQQNVPSGFVLQCSVQCVKKAPKINLHPDVGEGARPAGSSLQAGFFFCLAIVDSATPWLLRSGGVPRFPGAREPRSPPPP